MSAITLPKIVEALTNGLANLEATHRRVVDDTKKLAQQEDELRIEIAATRSALAALDALDDLLGEKETLTFRFPQ